MMRKYYLVGQIDVFRGPDLEHQIIFEAWMKKYPEIERIYKEDSERVMIGYESPSMTVHVAFTEHEWLLYQLKYPKTDYSWFMAE
jgi:hypothetical protein